MDQVTAVFVLPVTVAVICRVCDAPIVALEGLTVMLTGGGVNCTVALADFVGSATLVAVIVTVCAAVIVAGAV